MAGSAKHNAVDWLLRSWNLHLLNKTGDYLPYDAPARFDRTNMTGSRVAYVSHANSDTKLQKSGHYAGLRGVECLCPPVLLQGFCTGRCGR